MKYRPSKNIVVLSITSFFNDLSSEMLVSVFPAFFVSVLKTGAGSLGLVEGLANAASNLIKIYAGRVSDKLQKRKPFILAGYTLSVTTRPIYLLVSSVVGVVGLRFTDRIGKGLREGPRDAIISLSTPKAELGRAFGFHRMSDTLGAVGGPLIAYFILTKYPEGFHIVFLTAFIIGLVAIVSICFVTEVVGEAKKKNLSLSSLSIFSSEFKQYLLALFFLSMGSIPVAVLLLTTQHIGLALASIPLFYMLYNLSYAGFSFPAGGLSDRIGSKKIIASGYLILIGSYAFLATAESTPVLVIGFLILGLFPALTDGVQRALASELSHEEHRGKALGFVNATAGMGLLFAGVAGGYTWEHFGSQYALIAASVFILIGLVLLLRLNITVRN